MQHPLNCHLVEIPVISKIDNYNDERSFSVTAMSMCSADPASLFCNFKNSVLINL